MAQKDEALTPMMEQYLRMRKALPEDVLLFFRLGDFYELFFEDAVRGSELIGLTLTRRHGTPMCGVPYHSADGYIARIVQAGQRVAIAEQTSVPKQGKLVDREITRVISAGTVNDAALLNDRRHNFLAAIYQGKKNIGLAWIELSTGEFTLMEFPDVVALLDQMTRLNPTEVIVSSEQAEKLPFLSKVFPCDGYAFVPGLAESTLKAHFGVQSLDGFGCEGMPAAIGAAGGILYYLKNQLRLNIEHVRRLIVRQSVDHVQIDTASQRNLDLIDSRSGAKHSLLGALDRTVTSMGARLLRDWILHPSVNLEELTERQDLVAAFLAESFSMDQLREKLRNIRDIERLSSRLSQGYGNARDLQALGFSLGQLPELQQDFEVFKKTGGSLGARLSEGIGDFHSMVELLKTSLLDELPGSLKEGGLLRDGYSAALDELRTASRGGKEWLAALQETERKRTGIESLKIRFNNVFGYYIEITKANLSKVPEDYRRKQTTSTGERYITPELKEMESKILGAEERAQQLEYEEFLILRGRACEQIAEIQRTAAVLSVMDVLLCFAEMARLYRYTRPILENSAVLSIKDGRHPVLEQTLLETTFVPNDTYLEPEENRLLLITGPNMAGKSTYIRQVALISLMAQIGSFVPASEARVGLVDRIFCRVGASDDIARGQSTFMVEMSETALILNSATDRSLVLLDEIGRGTSTFDGLSIAWSVAEFLHDELKPRTLFATHYHELVDLEKSRAAVKNYNIAVREWNEEIIFLRKIVPGSANKSYGIQVARLAGLPEKIIERAYLILNHLESTSAADMLAKNSRAQGDSTPLDKAVQDEEIPMVVGKNEGMPQVPSINQLDLFG